MYHIAVDIGGTFTDCVVTEAGRIMAATKSPSTPHEPSQGVIDVLGVVSELLGLSVRDLLKRTEHFIHGSTVATNAILERKGPKTALLTTRGHEDTMIVGRVLQRVAGLAPSEYIDEYRLRKAEPIVPRARIIGIQERVDVEGKILAPLDERDALAQIDALVRDGVQSIAVSLLWSLVNPAHEQRLRALIRERHPAVYVAVSSDVAPLVGEYERTVTTVLTAFLGPKIDSYLDLLSQRLRELGFARELLLVQATGGLTPPQGLQASPLLFLDSGPVAGVLGGRHFARSYREPNMILMDMGGTSLDAAVVHRGEVQIDEAPVIDKHTYLIPKVDVRSIGAGGGSIIWVDGAANLKVGPQSAGAQPGPACYGLGGELPTTTDANLALGLLDPDYFLGGRKRLDRPKALAALERVARELGMSAVELAGGAFRIINAQMADLIRAVSIERGYDPRDFALLSFGGAGSTHAAFIAHDLKIRRVYVPRNAPVFCALGMLTTDLLHGYQMSCPIALPPSPQECARFNDTIAELTARVHAQFEGEGVAAAAVQLEHLAYVKYAQQVHELPLKVPFATMTADNAKQLMQLFEREYEATYGKGTASHSASIEIRRCRVEGRSHLDTATFADAAAAPDANAAAPVKKGAREVNLPDAQGRIRARQMTVYDGESMRPGHAVPGPCIIDRIADTVVVPEFARASVDANLTIRLDLD